MSSYAVSPVRFACIRITNVGVRGKEAFIVERRIRRLSDRVFSNLGHLKTIRCR